MCFPFLQRFPCSMCWMPGLHSVMSINAVLRRRRSQHQQLHQHPQEKMKKLQVEMRPAQPPNLTAHYIFVITDPLFLFLFPFLPPALPLFSVCPSVFEVPASYHRRGGSRHAPASNNDEELLQYAIHQSLLESRRAAGQVRTIEGKSVTFWTSTLYLNMLVCKWLIGHWILLLVMTSVLICPFISSTHPNLILSFSSCTPLFYFASRCIPYAFLTVRLCRCRRGVGMMQMGNSPMQCPAARVTGRSSGCSYKVTCGERHCLYCSLVL